MIELAITVIMIIVYTLYRIYCFAMRQSAKEGFWANRRIFYNDLFTRIYAIAQIALLIFVIACAILLFTTLAYGETPSLRDFRNPKFLELLLGTSILAFPQYGFICSTTVSKKVRDRDLSESYSFCLSRAFSASVCSLSSICCSLKNEPND